jgi:hypothetical protein
MSENDEARIKRALDVLRHGDVEFCSCRNEYGYVFPFDFPLLIWRGLAEEVRENGKTWLRLKDGERP